MSSYFTIVQYILCGPMQASPLALGIGRFAPTFVQTCHVTRKLLFARLFVDEIVLGTEPLAQLLAAFHLRRLLLNILGKVPSAPRARIELGQGNEKACHETLVLCGWLLWIPRGLCFDPRKCEKKARSLPLKNTYHTVQQIPCARSQFRRPRRALDGRFVLFHSCRGRLELGNHVVTGRSIAVVALPHFGYSG